MGMAQQQELPSQQKEDSKWSSRKLFPFAAITNAVTKHFTSSFEILLGLSIVVTAIVEITKDGGAYWLAYANIALLTIATLVDRREARLHGKLEVKK